MRLPVLLLAALVLAGCAAPAPADQEAPPASPGAPSPRAPPAGADDAPTFGAPALVASPYVAEPSAAVGPDGTLYALVWGNLYASRDGGATWEQPLPALDQVRGDVDIEVSPNGTIHVWGMVFEEGAQGAVLHHYRAGANASEWEPARPLEVAGSHVERHWSGMGRDGTLLITWRDLGNANMARVSHDDGVTWSEPARLTEEDWNFPGPPVVLDDLMLVPLSRGSAVTIARSTDRGATWDLLDGPSVNSQLTAMPAFAIDDAGTAYLAVAAPAPMPAGAAVGAPIVRVWASRDAGETWGAPRTLGPAGTGATLPAAIAGAPGRVAIAWYENARATTGSAGEWYVRIAVSANAGSDDATWTETRVVDEPIRVGSICTAGAGCAGAPLQDWSFRDLFGLALTPDGRPFVVFDRDPADRVPLPEAAGMTGGIEVAAAVATGGWRAWGP